VLELGQRLGEGLGHRARSVDRPDRYAARLRGDGSALQQPELPAAIDRPLDVLRAAEELLGATGEAEQAPERAAAQRRTVAAGALHHRTGRVEHVARAHGGAAHEALHRVAHGRHHAVVGATAHRVDAEEHAADLHVEVRLHQHRHRGVGRCTGGAAGAEDDLHGHGQLVDAVDRTHRRELPGLRGVRAVLRHRRAAGDVAGAMAAGGEDGGGLAQGGVTGHRGAGIDVVGESGGEHHAGEGGEAGARRSGEGGRLGARDGDAEGGRVPEVDERDGVGREPGPTGRGVSLGPWFGHGSPPADRHQPSTARSPQVFLF
jgi:hypothetical protein